MAVKARSIVMAVRDFLSFPNPVNEKAARTVAFVVMVVAAGLGSLAAVCLGCEVFALLMRAGLVPERVCLECADISGRVVSGRLARTSSTPRVRGRRAQLSRSQAISLRQAHGRRAAVTRAHERAHATARSRR